MAGDSCHPILPYMAQGANSAFEDAAVLGAVLSRVSRALQLPQATQLYESIRQFRTQKLHHITFQQGEELHLPDGSEQINRDELLARSFEPDDGPHGRW
jgi:salicylate hydroxylase